MPDTHHAGLERPETTETIGFSTTPEFEAALIDAGRLLEHAAAMGHYPRAARTLRKRRKP
jgi:hypothetical protein